MWNPLPPWPQAGAILVLVLEHVTTTTTTTQLHKRPTVLQITRVIHSVEINNQCIYQILRQEATRMYVNYLSATKYGYSKGHHSLTHSQGPNLWKGHNSVIFQARS